MQGPESHPIIKYRPDVDGLRAVAVLLVLADHLQIKAFGGYVGVDVFFVISGYLISSTIMKEMNEGKFSIVSFYERRVRRIFPALLVMLAVVSAITYWYLTPAEMVSYARSMLAALVSASNFWFWHQGGYFALPSYLKPLLHTWSLAVEEQFYILFPLFLVLVRRWAPKSLKTAIFVVAAISFVAACWIVRSDSVEAFFFAPLRAWELLIGTIVSQRYLPSLRSAMARNAASAAGLALILVPAFRYSPETVFPGVTALPPCLGAALIIAAGETGSSLVGRVLAWRPVVFVGLISYSLYLWHWPIIVFQQAGGMLSQGSMNSHDVKALVIGVSLVVATLSWRFVEQPFRKGRWRPGKTAVFALNGGATLALGALAFGMVGLHGLPGRFPPDAQRVAAYGDTDKVKSDQGGKCFVQEEQTFADFPQARCLPEQPGKRTILLVGDSTAGAAFAGLEKEYPEYDLMEATASNCPPLIEDVARTSKNCHALMDFVYRDFLLKHHVDVLLLISRWNGGDFRAIAHTVDYLHSHDIPVVLVGPGIAYDRAEPRIVAFALRDGHPETIRSHMMQEPRELDGEMQMLAQTDWHVPYVSVFEMLCKPECPVYGAPDAPLLADGLHLSPDGATLLMKAMRDSGQLK